MCILIVTYFMHSLKQAAINLNTLMLKYIADFTETLNIRDIASYWNTMDVCASASMIMRTIIFTLHLDEIFLAAPKIHEKKNLHGFYCL